MSESINTAQKVRQSLRIVWVLALAFLAACASRPEETEAIRTLIPTEAVDFRVQAAAIANQNDGFRVNDGKHTILALSAGGADGAFGAGVMAGWTASGSRPEFDVVTGVSTGSLLAVLAFLGPDYDPLIKELYTSQTNETIFKNRGLSGILGDSLYDNQPLKEQIEAVVDDNLLRRVAQEHAKGRRLYVATTNLDAGELVVWDMGKIAQGGRSNPKQHFQKVLRASAAVPGYFQPVYIKPKRGVQLRQAHVDGGVKEPVLYDDFMAESNEREKILYMVINDTTRRYNASQPVKPNIASIAQKTIQELMREIRRDTIFRHYASTSAKGIKFRLTSIPDFIPIAQESLNFDQERMRKLYKAGYDIGREGPETWATSPPTLGPAERRGAEIRVAQQ